MNMQCLIEGTMFVPKNAAFTEGGKNHPIFGNKLVSKTATILNDYNKNEKGSR